MTELSHVKIVRNADQRGKLSVFGYGDKVFINNYPLSGVVNVTVNLDVNGFVNTTITLLSSPEIVYREVKEIGDV